MRKNQGLGAVWQMNTCRIWLPGGRNGAQRSASLSPDAMCAVSLECLLGPTVVRPAVRGLIARILRRWLAGPGVAVFDWDSLALTHEPAVVGEAARATGRARPAP